MTTTLIFPKHRIKNQSLTVDFGEEMNLNEKAACRKFNRDKPLLKVLKSHAIMASGVVPKTPNESKLRWMSSDPNEICEGKKTFQNKRNKPEQILTYFLREFC